MVPAPLWQKYLRPDEHNRVPMDLNSMLVISEGKKIIIDAGLGDKLSKKTIRQWGLEWPEGTLIENIKKLGVTPEDIDIVIDTHLHADHCGGNTVIKEGDIIPTFPNAEYFVQRIEFAEARLPNVRTHATYLTENYVPIWTMDKLRLLHGDTQITKHVRCVVTRGHTRAHQSIIIEGEDNPIMFISDLASFAIQLARHAWVTAYDVEPLETIATKEIWRDWGLENKALFIFQHDPKTRAGKIFKDDDGKIQIEPKIGGSLA